MAARRADHLGVIGVNGVVHIGPAIAMERYDPGLLTAVLLFVPPTVLVVDAACRAAGMYRPVAAAVVLAAGLFMHAMLGASLILYLTGSEPEWLLEVIQPASIAVAYLVVASLDQRLRRHRQGQRPQLD